MNSCRLEWIANPKDGDVILLIEGLEAGKVRRGAAHEMQGWYWATKDALLPDGTQIEGGCVADAPVESQERAKEDLLACIAEVLREQAAENGR